MEDTRLPEMVFNAKPEGRRGFGRPRLRWLDDVEAKSPRCLKVEN
jgi:hypothetical protein